MKKIFSSVLMAVALLVSTNMQAENVAKIGTTEYATLQAAFDAVQDGETIQLINNVDLGGNMNLTLTGKTVTLDLNGKAWNLKKGTQIQTLGMRVYAGNIIVKGNGSIGYGDYAGGTIFEMYAGTKLTIENGTFNAKTTIKSDGEVVINDGTMKKISLGAQATALTVNGGTISTSITLPDEPENIIKVVINDGTVKTIATSNSDIRGTYVTVNGGEITWLQNSDSTFINGGKITNINGGFNVITNGDIETMYYEKNPDESPYYRTGSYDIRGGVFTNYNYICDEGERDIEQDFPANLKRVANTDPATSAQYPYTLGANSDYFTREVKKGNWGTVCYEKNITRATDAKLYQFVARNTAKTKVMVEEVKAEDIEINKPYLFNALAAIQMFAYGATAVTSLEENNGLIGTLTKIESTTEAAWVVKGNVILPAAAGSTVEAFRAYVNVDEIDEDDSQFESAAPKRGRLIFNIKGTPTELMNVNANVNANGKMMIGGQLVIIRDGKMFNAQGAAL